MGEINFSGIATGIDTESIITKLMDLERSRIPGLQRDKSNFEKQRVTVNDIISKLKNISTTALGLDTKTEISAFTATSADETKYKATASGSAAPGQYNITVSALAAAEHERSQAFTSNSISATNSLTITSGGVTQTVAYNSGETLDTFAARINSSHSQVSATVISDGSGNYYLEVAALQTGTGTGYGEISITDNRTPDLFTFSTTQSASDASFVMDSLTITRKANQISDAITGVTLDLKATSASAVKLTVDRDITGESDKAKKLVDDYNAAILVVGGQLKYSGAKKGGDTLFADATLRNLQRQLQTAVTSSYTQNGNTSSLKEFGISTNSDGTLKFDTTTFSAAAKSDHQKFIDLFTGSSGFAAKLDSIVTDFTKAGATYSDQGFLVTKQKNLDDQIKDAEKAIELVELRADKLGDSLRKMFSRLETTVSTLRSQGDQLLAALGRL
ncbi:MAG: flagellar filament capping protein FliD [Deltaproteobacteria bacterium]|nr:flagellar filament capping protein FliD [Deltaproteobacteria bacterium]